MEIIDEVPDEQPTLSDIKKNVYHATMSINLALKNAKKSQDHPVLSKLSVPSSPKTIRSRSNSVTSNLSSPSPFRKQRRSLIRSSQSTQEDPLFTLQMDKSVADVFQTVSMINQSTVTRLNEMLNKCSPKDLLENKLLRRQINEASHQLAKLNYQLFHCANEIFANTPTQNHDDIALIMSHCDIRPNFTAHAQQAEKDPTVRFLQQMRNSMLISLLTCDQNQNGQEFVRQLAKTLRNNPRAGFILQDYYSTNPRSFMIDPQGIDAYPKSEFMADYNEEPLQRVEGFFNDASTVLGNGCSSIISCPIFPIPEHSIMKELRRIDLETEEILTQLDAIPKTNSALKGERDRLITRRDQLYAHQDELQIQLRSTRGEFFNHSSVEDSVCCLVQGSLSYNESGNLLLYRTRT